MPSPSMSGAGSPPGSPGWLITTEAHPVLREAKGGARKSTLWWTSGVTSENDASRSTPFHQISTLPQSGHVSAMTASRRAWIVQVWSESPYDHEYAYVRR